MKDKRFKISFIWKCRE